MAARTVIDFPVGPNVPCWLSNSKTESRSYWKSITIIHGTLVPEYRKDRGRDKSKVFFYDRVFIPMTVDSENFTQEMYGIERTLKYFITVVGGFYTTFAASNSYDEWINNTVASLNECRGVEYFLKTILQPSKSNRLFMSRGLFPHVSKSPVLSYSNDEDKHNSINIVDFKKYGTWD